MLDIFTVKEWLFLLVIINTSKHFLVFFRKLKQEWDERHSQLLKDHVDLGRMIDKKPPGPPL